MENLMKEQNGTRELIIHLAKLMHFKSFITKTYQYTCTLWKRRLISTIFSPLILYYNRDKLFMLLMFAITILII